MTRLKFNFTQHQSRLLRLGQAQQGVEQGALRHQGRHISGEQNESFKYYPNKVEQRAYFECLCGGTEEGREKPGALLLFLKSHQKFHVSSLPGDVGYRVQCSECGTEQHAECVKYDIKDPYR